VWMVAAAAILIGAVLLLRWAAKNDQFDENIKYVVFDENDKDKMDPEEYKKSREVIAQQEELRKEYLRRKAERYAARHKR